MRWSSVTCCAGLVWLAGPGFGQAINIDAGDPATTFGVPANTYAAAGMPGCWNPVDGTPGTVVNNLLDVTGATTNVSVTHFGGTGNFDFNHPLTTGGDESLMDDLNNLGAVTNMVTFDFAGLTDGAYKVRSYAWAPDNRTGFVTQVTVVGGMVGPQSISGAWPGMQRLGVTYAQDVVNVSGGTLQILAMATTGCGSLNGFQIEPTIAFTGFCTAKTTGVCGPASIAAGGVPSATATSGFVVAAGPTRGCRAGLLLYSNQPVAAGVPFGGPGDGMLCLTPTGLRRAGPIESGGTSPAVCDGLMAINMNKFAQGVWSASGCAPPPGQNNPAGFLTNMGTAVNAQIWGRDSTSTGQVISDGIGWVIGP